MTVRPRFIHSRDDCLDLSERGRRIEIDIHRQTIQVSLAHPLTPNIFAELTFAEFYECLEQYCKKRKK